MYIFTFFYINFLSLWDALLRGSKTKTEITGVSLGRESLLDDSMQLSFFKSVSSFSSIAFPADSASFNRKSKGFVRWAWDSETSSSWDFSFSQSFTGFFSSDGFRCRDRTPCSFSLYVNSGVVLVELELKLCSLIAHKYIMIIMTQLMTYMAAPNNPMEE